MHRSKTVYEFLATANYDDGREGVIRLMIFLGYVDHIFLVTCYIAVM